MALKDTLGQLDEAAKKQAEAEARRPLIIAAWQKAVSDLYTEIEQYLAEYITAGDITLTRGVSRHSEERLGNYECESLEIRAKGVGVALVNKGRLMMGSTGAITMSRVGKPQIVILSRHSADDAVPAQWHVNIDPRARQPGKARPPVYPMDKRTFELGLDYLLKA